jgi:hypothetical protein
MIHLSLIISPTATGALSSSDRPDLAQNMNVIPLRLVKPNHAALKLDLRTGPRPILICGRTPTHLRLAEYVGGAGGDPLADGCCGLYSVEPRQATVAEPDNSAWEVGVGVACPGEWAVPVGVDPGWRHGVMLCLETEFKLTELEVGSFWSNVSIPQLQA